MAIILFTWELGGGYGHLMLMSSIARVLNAEGHRVFIATKDILSAHRIFAGTGIELLATPRSQFSLVFKKQQTFAHLLANVGFGDTRHLESHANAWKNLYKLVRPDLVIFVHSPVALLAASGEVMKKAIMGSGFFIPPDVYPLPAFNDGALLNWDHIRAVEDGILSRVNALLQTWSQPQLSRLSKLYAQVDRIFLTTYPELEHYPTREKSAKYYGTINSGDLGGLDPVWPNGTGKKVYAYLKSFPTLPRLLEVINQCGHPTLIYIDVLDPAMQNRFSSKTTRFEMQRLNMSKVAASCDVAITHATLAPRRCCLKRQSRSCLFL